MAGWPISFILLTLLLVGRSRSETENGLLDPKPDSAQLDQPAIGSEFNGKPTADIVSDTNNGNSAASNTEPQDTSNDFANPNSQYNERIPLGGKGLGILTLGQETAPKQEQPQKSDDAPEYSPLFPDGAARADNTVKPLSQENSDAKSGMSLDKLQSVSKEALLALAKKIPLNLSPEQMEQWRQNISDTLSLSALDPGRAMLPLGNISNGNPSDDKNADFNPPFFQNGPNPPLLPNGPNPSLLPNGPNKEVQAEDQPPQSQDSQIFPEESAVPEPPGPQSLQSLIENSSSTSVPEIVTDTDDGNDDDYYTYDDNGEDKLDKNDNKKGEDEGDNYDTNNGYNEQDYDKEEKDDDGYKDENGDEDDADENGDYEENYYTYNVGDDGNNQGGLQKNDGPETTDTEGNPDRLHPANSINTNDENADGGNNHYQYQNDQGDAPTPQRKEVNMINEEWNSDEDADQRKDKSGDDKTPQESVPSEKAESEDDDYKFDNEQLPWDDGKPGSNFDADDDEWYYNPEEAKTSTQVTEKPPSATSPAEEMIDVVNFNTPGPSTQIGAPDFQEGVISVEEARSRKPLQAPKGTIILYTVLIVIFIAGVVAVSVWKNPFKNTKSSHSTPVVHTGEEGKRLLDHPFV